MPTQRAVAASCSPRTPDQASHHFTYAVALMAAGDIDEAREHMARATAAAGDDRWADLLTRAGDVGLTNAVAAVLANPDRLI